MSDGKNWVRIPTCTKLSKLIIHLLRESYYYGDLAAESAYYTSEDLKVAARVFLDQNLMPVIEFMKAAWKKCSVEALAELTTHEILHILLRHQPKCDIDFIADDLAINENLVSMVKFDKEFGYVSVNYKRLGFPPNLTSAQYKKLLEKNRQVSRKPDKDNQTGGQGSGEGEKDKQKSKGKKSSSANVPVTFEVNVDGSFDTVTFTVDKVHHKIDKAIEYKLANLIQKAFSRSCGSIPGNMQAIISEWLSLKAQVPWQSVLRNFHGNTIKISKKYTWGRRNKRVPWQNPGSRNIYQGRGAVLFDCSGSMSDKAYSESAAETYKMSQIAPLRVFWFDTKVHDSVELNKYSDKKLLSTRKGYGGTDFRPVIKEALKHKPDFIVIFTDAWGPWPEKIPNNVPLLVVMFGNGKEKVPDYAKIVYEKGNI